MNKREHCADKRSIAFYCILLVAVFSFAQLLAPSVGAARTLYVKAGAAAGNDGGTPNTPLPFINAALKRATPGDVISIAPGDYHESLTIPVSRLTIRGDSSNNGTPAVRISPLDKSVDTLITDARDTLWQNITFQSGQDSALANLRNFSGRFEHCRFVMSAMRTAMVLDGERASFVACSFEGHPGPEAAIMIIGRDGETNFVYCLFKDINGGVLQVGNNGAVRFTNCLLANCSYTAIRLRNSKATISAINTVFYLGRESSLFLQSPDAPRINLENCLYCPAPGEYLDWQALPLKSQTEINAINSITASPRFAGGRKVLLNFCIDDTINSTIWSKLTPYAEKMGLKITLALNADDLTPDRWGFIVPQINRGFEVASHGAVHSSMLAKEVLQLAWSGENVKSAVLSITADKDFEIRINGEKAFSLPLMAEPRPTLETLVTRLQEKGFRAALVDRSHARIPAYLLAPVEAQDIFFERFMPSIALDTSLYMHYMLAESREKIESGLIKYQAKQRRLEVFVCPYAETNSDIVSEMDKTGYILSRSRTEKQFKSARDAVNLYFIESVPVKEILEHRPVENIDDMFRMYFDYFKYYGSILGLYAHGGNECSVEQWVALFTVVANDKMIRTVSLHDMADEIKEYCQPKGDGVYQCPPDQGPVAGEISFRPGPLSPLLRAGKVTGYQTNFAGESIPPGSAPNIGLF